MPSSHLQSRWLPYRIRFAPFVTPIRLRFFESPWVMGFAAYFLICWDLIKYAREHGIRVGPGRGSAAGCAIAYCLRITDLDPIKYDLLFERFLNPGRIQMPDIDMPVTMRRVGPKFGPRCHPCAHHPWLRRNQRNGAVDRSPAVKPGSTSTG